MMPAFDHRNGNLGIGEGRTPQQRRAYGVWFLLAGVALLGMLGSDVAEKRKKRGR